MNPSNKRVEAAYTIMGKSGGKLLVEKYDPAKHRYHFIWPYPQYVESRMIHQKCLELDFSEQNKFAFSAVFAFNTGFDFRARYKSLKEQGWHCMGPSIERLSFDFAMKNKLEGNGEIKVSLNLQGTPYIYVQGGTSEERTDKFNQLINIATMLNS